MSEELNDKEQSLVEHLTDLRDSLLKIFYGIGLFFILLLPFYTKAYQYFARPVLNNLLEGQTMLAQQPIDVFLTPIKVCLFLAVLITIPWTLYQIWRFVAPAMYQNEKKFAFALLFSSTILFYLGVLFAYFVILPLLFSFLVGVGKNLTGVVMMPDITAYLGLSLKLFLAFGLVFEVPVITVIAIRMGVVSIESLVKKRPYIILIAFTVGMLLTPPDVFSQTLLALPMLLLFEVGILVAKYLERNNKETEK